MIIYKYIFTMQQLILGLPVNSKVLSVQMQNDNVCLWINISKEETAIERRVFDILNTGQKYKSGTYIGTAIFYDLVFHVFENLKYD